MYDFFIFIASITPFIVVGYFLTKFVERSESKEILL
jgi:hypothetical protein